MDEKIEDKSFASSAIDGDVVQAVTAATSEARGQLGVTEDD